MSRGPGYADALGREVARAGTWFATLTEPDWARPTRCAPLSVFEISVHALRGSLRIHEMLEGGPLDAEPEKDGATYFLYDPVAEGPLIVRRTQETAAGFDPATFAKAWIAGWDEGLGAARDAIAAGDPVYGGAFGRIRMSEYLRTRLVEVTVHHMDARDGLGLAPDPDPSALGAVAEVLRELLGTDARLLGIDDLRLAIVGTGRAPLTGVEREALGPLSERFPLLA